MNNECAENTEEEKEIANAISIEDLLGNSTSSYENPYQGYIDTAVEEILNKTGL